MKYLLLGDLHFGRNTNLYFTNYDKQILKWLKEIIEQNSIEKIIFLGDFYDKKKSGDWKYVNVIKKLWLELPVNEIIMIVGNHDLSYSNSYNASSISALFDGIEKITIVQDDIHVKDNFVFVPYIHKNFQEKFQKKLEKLPKNFILFGHFDIEGFMLNSFKVSEESSLSKNFLKNFQMVYSGHYHKKQEEDNIFYTGSVLQVNFGELENKFVYILNEEGRIEQEIKNPYRIYEKIKLTKEDIKDRRNLKKILNEYQINMKIIKVFLESSDIKDYQKVSEVIEELQPYRATIEMNKSDDMEIELSHSFNQNLSLEELEEAFFKEIAENKYLENVKEVKEEFERIKQMVMEGTDDSL